MKRVIVAGGAGFIGSHLCDTIINNGDQVICLDNLITGSKDNIVHLLSNPRFDYTEVDVTSVNILKLIKDKYDHIDEIYDLASPASPVDYILYPIETLTVGSFGAKNLLDLALHYGSRILMASTSEVYGDPLEHPQKEEYWGNVNPIGIRSCYDESKRFMEAITAAYIRKYGLNAKIARIFNTYGPRMRLNDGRVVPNFISQALNNEDITVYGDGSQTRSFCYVSDLVNGLILLMSSDVNTPVNLGNPDERSVMDFAKDIVGMLPTKSKIITTELPKDDPQRRKPDITKAKEYLSWFPKVGFKEGVQLTIEYFRKRVR
jgi:nucleoside-diphosphate-sugar epimerase